MNSDIRWILRQQKEMAAIHLTKIQKNTWKENIIVWLTSIKPAYMLYKI